MNASGAARIAGQEEEMANRALDLLKALGKERVVLSPVFQPAGTAAPLLLSGLGGMLTRAAKGLFLLQFTDPFHDILDVGAELQLANPQMPSAWVGGTAYTLGETVQPATRNGYYYACTVAGTSAATASQPTWPLEPGSTVIDNTATWTCMGPCADASLAIGLPCASGNPAAWVASTAHVAGDYVTDGSGHLFQCQVPGTTGASAPAWVIATAGASLTVDSTVAWRFMGSPTIPGGAIVPLELVSGSGDALLDSGGTAADQNNIAISAVAKNSSVKVG